MLLKWVIMQGREIRQDLDRGLVLSGDSLAIQVIELNHHHNYDFHYDIIIVIMITTLIIIMMTMMMIINFVDRE